MTKPGSIHIPLAEITRRIVVASSPDRIILFGSMARGEDTRDSDVDLLVIKQGVKSPRQESVRLRRILRGLLTPVDIIVATPEQVEKHRNTIGLLYKSALAEGIVLYERKLS